MPYKSNSELPSWVKEMPEHAQDTYRKAFNSAYEQYKDDGKAAATAITAVKHKYEKRGGKWMRKRSLNGSDTFAVEPLLSGVALYCSKRGNVIEITTEDGKLNIADRLPALAEHIAPCFSDTIERIDGIIVFSNDGSPVSKSDSIKMVLGMAEALPYTFYINDCISRNKNAEWIERQRTLVSSVKMSEIVKLSPNSIINNEDDLLSVSGKLMSHPGSTGVVVICTDGEDSVRSNSIASGSIVLRNAPAFECYVESKKKVNNLNIYKLKGIVGNTLPSELDVDPGKPIAVRPVAVRIHPKGAEFLMASVVPDCDYAVPLNYFEKYVYSENGDKEIIVNMDERVVIGANKIERMPMEVIMYANVPDGLHDFGVVYWTEIPSFRSPNKASSGIIVDEGNELRVVSGFEKSTVIDKKLVRNTDVFCKANVIKSKYTLDMEHMQKLTGSGYAFLENKKRAIKMMSKSTDPFLIVSDKPCKWAYKLKYANIKNTDEIQTLVLNENLLYDAYETKTQSGSIVTGELFFESNDRVYCLTILNPIGNGRDKLINHASGDSISCIRTHISNPFNFLKHTLSMDESISLKDIMTDSVLYDLASKPALWLSVSGWIKHNDHAVYLKDICSGTLEHGVKRTDMNEFKFDKFGRVVVSLNEDSAGCDKNGNLEAIWNLTIPEKMQEWYVNTHDLDAEISDASSKAYNLIWQAPGKPTQTHFFKE